MKAVVAAFNQEKALVGAFSVITNLRLRMELFEALVPTVPHTHCPLLAVRGQHRQRSLRGACERDHHLRVQTLAQPGAAGGHPPQHGEVRGNVSDGG